MRPSLNHCCYNPIIVLPYERGLVQTIGQYVTLSCVFQCLLREGLGQTSSWSLFVMCPAALRDGLRIDVKLVSLYHVFPCRLTRRAQDRRQASLSCHACFPPSLQERLQRRYTYGNASSTLHSTARPEERFHTSERHPHTGESRFESVNICHSFFAVLQSGRIPTIQSNKRVLQNVCIIRRIEVLQNVCRIRRHTEFISMSPAEILYYSPYISPAKPLWDSRNISPAECLRIRRVSVVKNVCRIHHHAEYLKCLPYINPAERL